MPTNASWTKHTISGSTFYIKSQEPASPVAVAEIDSSSTEVLLDSLASPITTDQTFTSVVDPGNSSYFTLQSGSSPNILSVDTSTNLVYYASNPGTITNKMYWEYTGLPAGTFQLLYDDSLVLYCAVDDDGVPIIGSQLYVDTIFELRTFAVYTEPNFKGTREIISQQSDARTTMTPKSIRIADHTYVKLYSEENYGGTVTELHRDRRNLPEGFVIKSYEIFVRAEEPKEHCEKHEKGKTHC